MPSLYPYQKVGADFLATRRRAYLADRMGLGKTAQAIRAANLVGARQGVTIVCPASAVPNWQAEWDMWEGPGEPTILSYSSLIRRDWKKWKPSLVILDEAHYAKSPSAQRTRAALGIARRADRAWLLSATPMPNHPGELWPPVKYLWPELAEEVECRTAEQWLYTFCHTRPTLYGPKPYAVRNGARLRQLLKGIMLRRTLDDVGLELPPLRVDLHRLPKDKVAAAALQEYADMEGGEDAYTSTLRRVLGQAKAEPVARQIVDELKDGQYDKVVVLYYHKAVRDVLVETFRKGGISVCGFGGETPQKLRQKAIEAFQTDPKFRVFLAQQSAAGIAINLTAASEVVLVEPAWSPEDNRQAIARIHRIGQDQPCRARVFALSGTLDEAVLGTIAQKVRMQEAVGLTP